VPYDVMLKRIKDLLSRRGKKQPTGTSPPDSAAAVESARTRSAADRPLVQVGPRVVHRPIRVLIDSRLRVAPTSRLYRGESGQTWVLCSKRVSPARLRAVTATGAKLLQIPLAGRSGHLDLRKAMAVLASEGLTEIFVEGGGELGAAMLRASLVDEVHWFLAPTLLGGDARAALGALSIGRLGQAPQLSEIDVRPVGRDVWVRGRVAKGGAPVSGRRKGSR